MRRKKDIFLWFLILMVLVKGIVLCAAYAGGPPDTPMLRLETGMHTASIMRIGVDAENRYLVTGSLDKTVRVWELATGRLIKTLRIPIGEKMEGAIYAVAISSDGRTIAVGGRTGSDWDRSMSIYLFDRETGKMIRRISGHPNVIVHLAYSRDDRFLVAGLGEGGIRIYRTTDYRLIAEDLDYSDQVYGADFDAAGRLATASFDGSVRLYGKDFKLLSKKKAPGGKRPYSVRFSPDGVKVAVGFFDSTAIDVLSGKGLAPLYAPEVGNVDNGNLAGVAWSLDGQFLYAAGEYQTKGIYPIRRWAEGGKGAPVDLPASLNMILHILPLRDGGVAYGTGDPAFGLLDSSGKRILYKGSSVADYRENQGNFLISPDGSIIQFAYEPGGKSPALFSIDDQVIKLDPKEESALSAPIIAAEDLKITGWKDSFLPKLNNRPIKLLPNEKA